MDYKFNWLNSGLEIENPIVTWTGAGFLRGDNPKVTIDISLITDSAKYSVQLSVNKEAVDRSDEAIDGLTLLLLQPYEV